MNSGLSEIKTIVESQEQWRGRETLNLIASENRMSQTARQFLNTDFHHRYAEGLIGERAYQGQKYHDQIELITQNLTKSLFHADFADVRAPSATIANLAIFYALCKPNDPYFATTIPNGAHISYREVGSAGCRKLAIHDIPYNFEQFNIDVPQFENQLTEVKPKLITLGGSVYLFPHPVHEIAKICQDLGIIIHYDGSHVLGLIAGHQFQDPLVEGADILIGSTHKTFPGPQGAIIVSSDHALEKNPKLYKKIQAKIFPGLVSNHHLWRFPPLAITLLEMEQYGSDYAHQVIRNAQALAKALNDQGFQVLAKSLGYTQSHQILMDVHEYGGGGFIATQLEQVNIIVNKNTIPGEDPSVALVNPSGLRLGVQELTRMGMKEAEMKITAEFFADLIIHQRSPQQIRSEVVAFRTQFQTIHYSFDTH